MTDCKVHILHVIFFKNWLFANDNKKALAHGVASRKQFTMATAPPAQMVENDQYIAEGPRETRTSQWVNFMTFVISHERVSQRHPFTEAIELVQC